MFLTAYHKNKAETGALFFEFWESCHNAFAKCLSLNLLGLLAFVVQQRGWGGHKGEQADVI